MISIKFPDMFSSSKTNILDGITENNYQHLKLLLLSNKMEFFGDPDYGATLHSLIYDLNNTILADLVIDDIYTSIASYMPEIEVKRNDIKIFNDGKNLIAKIKGKSLINFTTDIYNINLTNVPNEDLEG